MPENPRRELAGDTEPSVALLPIYSDLFRSRTLYFITIRVYLSLRFARTGSPRRVSRPAWRADRKSASGQRAEYSNTPCGPRESAAVCAAAASRGDPVRLIVRPSVRPSVDQSRRFMRIENSRPPSDRKRSFFSSVSFCRSPRTISLYARYRRRKSYS